LGKNEEKIDAKISVTNPENTKNEENEEEILTSKNDKIISDGYILKEWIMKDTASQLTYHGLIELSKNMKEKEFAVFFRGNHFSTLYKNNGLLYLLVTDQGFLNESQIVWEVLNETDGDTQWVDSSFNLYTPKNNFSPISSSGADESTALAMKLQAEEDQKYAKMIAENDQYENSHTEITHHPDHNFGYVQDSLPELVPTSPPATNIQNQKNQNSKKHKNSSKKESLSKPDAILAPEQQQHKDNEKGCVIF